MPANRTLKAIAATCAAALTAAGCSTGEAGDADDAAAAVRTLLSLCAQERGSAVLHLLTVPAQRAFIDGKGTAEGCALVLGVASAPGPSQFADARIAHVSAGGGLARVEVEGPGWRTTVEAEDTGDRWLVTHAPLPA